MNSLRRVGVVSLALSCFLTACHKSSSTPPATGGGNVNGLVSDIGSGARLSGATVSGGGQTATTDAQGEFTLSGLSAGTVNLSITLSGYAPGYANAKAGDKPAPALVSLKKRGTPQPYSASQTMTLSEKTEAGPYALILQPNSLDTSDSSLKVAITPLDPTKERQALPGSLVSGGTSPSVLIPVTFAEFTVLDSAGKRVNLKSSASAVVELPIPPSLRSTYSAGAKIHCYAYDATTGVWQDFVEGTVQPSSVDGSSPVLAASVRHLSWYGGAPQGNNCADVYVSVVSAVDGKPLPNARVEATPGTVAYTDANGEAVVVAALGTQGSTYTAYQTGYDVDGSLTGIKGAKYIEFGEVQEDLFGLVQRPCSGAGSSMRLASGPEMSVVGAQGNPLVIKVGLVKNLLYQATAILATGGNGSNGNVSVILEQGVPGPNGKLVNPGPASGAKITVAENGGTPAPLVELAAGSGIYASNASLTITAGKSYTLAIDPDGHGSIAGTSAIVAVGNLAWSNPTNGADVAGAGFTASWTDSGTAAANPAYAPLYLATLSGTSDFASYIGTDRQFPVKSSVTPGANLSPGTYSASLLGFSGFYASPGGGLQIPNNITGTGITGTFYSLGSVSSSITFTVH